MNVQSVIKTTNCIESQNCYRKCASGDEQNFFLNPDDTFTIIRKQDYQNGENAGMFTTLPGCSIA